MATKVDLEKLLQDVIKMQDKADKYYKRLLKENKIEDPNDYDYTAEQEQLKRIIMGLEGIAGCCEEVIENITK